MGVQQDVSTNVVQATAAAHSDEDAHSKPHKWYYYLWDTLDKPKEERWFMFKLDAALLTFASLGILPRFSPVTTLYSLFPRILHQIPRPDEYKQCVCIWNVCKKPAMRTKPLLISS